MNDAAIFWAQFICWCVSLSALGTLTWKRPGTVALCVTGIIGLFMALVSMRTDAWWLLATIICVICALPLTIVTAIVTDNLMDKYGSDSDDK